MLEHFSVILAFSFRIRDLDNFPSLQRDEVKSEPIAYRRANNNIDIMLKGLCVPAVRASGANPVYPSGQRVVFRAEYLLYRKATATSV
jgi:hypothetical protein